MIAPNADHAASMWEAVKRRYAGLHGDTNFSKWLDSPVTVGAKPPRWDGIAGVLHELEEYLDWTDALGDRVVVDIAGDDIWFTAGTARLRLRAKVRGGELMDGDRPICDVRSLQATQAVVLDLLGDGVAGRRWRRRVAHLARTAPVSRVRRSHTLLGNLPWTFPSHTVADRWVEASSRRLARRFARADAVGAVALLRELEAS
jgi:hypothetical protein